jgi:hypothetical protein
VRTNLILQSEAFNTTWTDNAATVTPNTTANPLNGALTADTITLGAGTVIKYLQQSVTAFNGLITHSVYLKAGTHQFIQLLSAETAVSANFDLVNGTASSVSSTAQIVALANGWYRCSISYTATISPSAVYIWAVDSLASARAAATASTGTFIAFGYQHETGDIATDYIATTTAAVSVGPVANVPRLDYLDSSSPRLLLEPQRTNAITFSEQMDNAAWIKNVNAAVTANQAISPDGYQNADLVSNTLVGGGMDYYQLVTGSASTTYTYSVFVKAATHTKCALRAFVGATSPFTTTPAAYFDLATASVIQSYGSATNAKIEAVGSNGWYRVSMTFPTIGTSHYLNLFPLSDTYSVSASNAPLNYSSTGGVYFWGAQYEIGAYATSYINTLGAAVTRVADAASKTSASAIIGQTEGTVYSEFVVNGFANFGTPLCINNGTTDESVWLTTFANGDIRAEVFSSTGGGIQASFTKSGNVVGQTYKIAIGYAVNNFAFFVNGVQVGTTDTSGQVPVGMNRVDFDYANPATFVKSALEIKQALLFKTRLSNADLATLTTL